MPAKRSRSRRDGSKPKIKLPPGHTCPSLPDDILYMIFELVDADDSEFHFYYVSDCVRQTAAARLPERRHPLSRLARVCKRWKRVVDDLLYVNIGLTSASRLHNLLEHVDNDRHARTAIATRTKRIRVVDRITRGDSETRYEALPRLLSMMPLLEVATMNVWMLPATAVSTLCTYCGGTLRHLSLKTHPAFFEEELVRNMAHLVCLKSLIIDNRDYSEWGNTTPITVHAACSDLALPSLETLSIRSWHMCWTLCDFLLALKCKTLLKVHLDWLNSAATPAVRSFLKRNSHSIRVFDLAPPQLRNVVPILRSLKSPPPSHALHSGPELMIFEALTHLRLPIPLFGYDTTDRETYETLEWLEDLAGSPPACLKSIAALRLPLDQKSSLDWRRLGRDKYLTTHGVTQRYTSVAAALMSKGIDLLDTHGFSFLEQATPHGSTAG